MYNGINDAMNILNSAMQQCACLYISVNYRFNADVGTAYFKIDY